MPTSKRSLERFCKPAWWSIKGWFDLVKEPAIKNELSIIKELVKEFVGLVGQITMATAGIRRS